MKGRRSYYKEKHSLGGAGRNLETRMDIRSGELNHPSSLAHARTVPGSVTCKVFSSPQQEPRDSYPVDTGRFVPSPHWHGTVFNIHSLLKAWELSAKTSAWEQSGDGVCGCGGG
ncbi:hypothetical protein H1C71_031832 [Ictidomys tridecemlineatus]|nr:hypothetical protein H1C71_031832 [Ictidomys tridecemlineatus]